MKLNTSLTKAGLTRRRMILQTALFVGGTGLSTAVAQQQVDTDHGRVNPPLDIPAIPVRNAEGTLTTLAALTRGKATALHVMFANCSTTCPIQGAIFQRIQTLLPNQTERGIQLLSISIDPENDTPHALRNWLKHFHARDGWIAAVPSKADLAAMQSLFGQGRREVENHATQVQIINRRGQLVWRTRELPSADSVAAILQKV